MFAASRKAKIFEFLETHVFLNAKLSRLIGIFHLLGAAEMLKLLALFYPEHQELCVTLSSYQSA